MTHLLESDDNDINNITFSEYIDIDTFSKQFKDVKSKLSIVSLNIQRLNTNFDEFKITIDELNTHHPISIICIQETWLGIDDSTELYHLPDYHLISKSLYAGLITYVHIAFTYNVLEIVSNPNVQSDNIINLEIRQDKPIWESLFIEIKHKTPDSKTYVVGNIYRRPNPIVDACNEFTEELSTIMNLLTKKKRTIYLSGDFNIDLLKIYERNHYNLFYDTMISTGFYPKISIPTRFDQNHSSATLIDQIYSNDYNTNVSGVFTNIISDHQMIYTYSKETYQDIRQNTRFIEIESNNPVNLEQFLNELKNLNIQQKFNMNPFANPNTNYRILTDLLTETKNAFLPKKRVKFNKKKHNKCPWMTQGILNSINTKDKMYKQLIKTPPQSQNYNTQKVNLRTYKNIIRRSICQAKKDYYHNTFKNYSNDLRKTWHTINDTLNKHKTNKTFPREFNLSNGEKVSDHKIIANSFNNFFVNIGKSTCANIQSNETSFDRYLINKPDCNFHFKSVTTEEVLNIINSLKLKSSRGVDELSNKLIKYIKDAIVEPLTVIINQMINTGIYPDLLKISKVIPLYKKDDKTVLSNYRPISLLPSISKNFEKVIHLQLSEYLENNKLISPNQYGFRKKHSTEFASLHLVDHLNYEIDMGRTPLNIYLDLSKAFDTLNHDILLSKLKYYGVSGISHNLLLTYLSNRKQFVQFESSKSDLLSINQGVPQGSILGPLLFIIYINDLPSSCRLFDCLMYADDTTLFCSLDSINLENRERIINNELQNVSNWLVSNKLTLNVNKTKYMMFYKHPKVVAPLNIKINNNTISRVNTFNFLGLHLNSNLSWNTHITMISKKITRVTGLLYKLKYIFPKNILLSLYNTLILPHLNYCLLSWGKHNNYILLLQKRAMRSICHNTYKAHSEPLFKECHTLKINDIQCI